MAKARPLVGGFLERISVTAFEKYHRDITDLVRSQHGLYALYKNDRLYYVGLAVNLGGVRGTRIASVVFLEQQWDTSMYFGTRVADGRLGAPSGDHAAPVRDPPVRP